MNNRMTFTRDIKGDFVNTTISIAKKSFEVVYDVARAYAEIINGLLTLGIKIGLFIMLLPYITKFCINLFVGLGGF